MSTSRQHLSWQYLPHIMNISAVTDPILTKLFGHNFWRPWFILIKKFLDQILFDPIFFGPTHFFGHKILKKLDPNFFSEPKFCEPKILLTHNSFGSKLFWTNIFWDLIFFLTQIVLDQIFLHPKFCLHLFWVEIYEQLF